MAASNAAKRPSGAIGGRSGLKGILYLKSGFDMPFFIILMITLAVGMVCLFSASFSSAFYEYGDSYYYIKSQLRNAALGLGVMMVASCVDYRLFKKFKIPYIVLAVTLALLGLVLLLPATKNVHRWIPLGPIQIQPSEIAKFAIILFLAYWCDLHKNEMKSGVKGFLIPLGVLGVVCGLVVLEPHLSGTILILMIGLVMLFIGGTRIGYLAGLIVAGVAAVYVVVFVFGYERERIDVWLDPIGTYYSGSAGFNDAWQIIQSLYAIGSGGLMGEGLGNSRQKHLFLPEPQNDFIFSIICEEMGFIGALLVIVLFALLVWRGFHIAMRAPDRFSCLMAIGLSAQIGIQALLNLAVVTNAFPNTGISLPFFSYGGSSLVMLMAQMGVLLSISRHTKEKSQA